MHMTPEQDVELLHGYSELKQHFEGIRNGIEAERNKLKQDVASYIADPAAHLPVTPNLLVDTKHFSRLCGGQVNTAVEVIAAHGAPWTASWYQGTTGTGTAKVITVDRLVEEGAPFGGALALAANGPNHDPPFYGSDFKVLILDVTITSNCADGTAGAIFVLNQGCPTYTCWYRGQFVTQASLLFNLIEHTGAIKFLPHLNMPPGVQIDRKDLGAGWVYRQRTQAGWGGCHQPRFIGIGHMKVAIALPYIGFGDHGGRFVWAGSVGRYSHVDRLAPGFTY